MKAMQKKNVRCYVDYKEQFIDEDGFLTYDVNEWSQIYYDEQCWCNVEKMPKTKKQWFDTYVEIAREYVIPMCADFGIRAVDEIAIMIENTVFGDDEEEGYYEGDLDKYADKVLEAALVDYDGPTEATGRLVVRPVELTFTKSEFDHDICVLSKKVDAEDKEAWLDIYYRVAVKCWEDAKRKYRGEEKDGDIDEYTFAAVEYGLSYIEYKYDNGNYARDYMKMHDDKEDQIIFSTWDKLCYDRRLMLENLSEIKEKVFC